MRLDDGTVIPSYMGSQDTSFDQDAPGFFDEVSILVGEVQRVIACDDPDNSLGQFTEYVVNVWRRQGTGAQERLALRCAQADQFGSVADWFRFSYRASTSTQDKKPLGNGATVLVACVNGDRSNAYIIGGIPQPNRNELDPRKADGRYMRSRFNGVEMSVNDDGSFELKVPGATNADGEPDARDENNKGSKLSIAANGDITIDDQNGSSVKVSPGSKTIEVIAAEKLAEKAADVKVEGSASWKLKAPVVVVDSPDIRLGGDEELMDPTQGLVHGQGVDPFTGMPYFALGNASTVVKAKKQ